MAKNNNSTPKIIGYIKTGDYYGDYEWHEPIMSTDTKSKINKKIKYYGKKAKLELF